MSGGENLNMEVDILDYNETKNVNHYEQPVGKNEENALRTLGRLFHWKEYKDANTFVSNVIDGPKTLGGTISQEIMDLREQFVSLKKEVETLKWNLSINLENKILDTPTIASVLQKNWYINYDPSAQWKMFNTQSKEPTPEASDKSIESKNPLPAWATKIA